MLVFGDSITSGCYDNQGGWAKRLYNLYYQGGQRSFQNFSLPGATSKDIIFQLNRARVRKLFAENELKLIFAYGLNDAAVGFMDYITLDLFKDNTKRIVETILKYKAETVFAGLTIIDEDHRNGFGGLSFFSNQNIAQYNQVLKEVCGEYQLPFVDLYQATENIKEDYLRYLDDGIHPNSFGHRFILKQVIEIIDWKK